MCVLASSLLMIGQCTQNILCLHACPYLLAWLYIYYSVVGGLRSYLKKGRSTSGLCTCVVIMYLC